MDLQFLQNYAIAWFLFASAVDFYVTAKVFLNRGDDQSGYWEIFAMMIIATTNLYAAGEVSLNENLNQALITKFAFSFGTVMLLIGFYRRVMRNAQPN